MTTYSNLRLSTADYKDLRRSFASAEAGRGHRNLIPFEIFVISLGAGILFKSFMAFVTVWLCLYVLILVREFAQGFITIISMFWGSLVFVIAVQGGAWGQAIVWGLTGFLVSFGVHQCSLQHWQDVTLGGEEPLRLADFFRTDTKIPKAVKQKVIKRDGMKCARCSCPINLSFAHIVPIAKGGSNDASNIQILCSDCKDEKGEGLVSFP